MTVVVVVFDAVVLAAAAAVVAVVGWTFRNLWSRRFERTLGSVRPLTM